MRAAFGNRPHLGARSAAQVHEPFGERACRRAGRLTFWTRRPAGRGFCVAGHGSDDSSPSSSVSQSVNRVRIGLDCPIGKGWSASERPPTGPVRRAGARAPPLLLPLDPTYAYPLSLDLAGDAGGRIEVLVNGMSTGACSADDDGSWCEVTIRPVRSISWVTLIRGAPAAGTQPIPLTFPRRPQRTQPGRAQSVQGHAE